jgi:hypothetical protein
MLAVCMSCLLLTHILAKFHRSDGFHRFNTSFLTRKMWWTGLPTKHIRSSIRSRDLTKHIRSSIRSRDFLPKQTKEELLFVGTLFDLAHYRLAQLSRCLPGGLLFPLELLVGSVLSQLKTSCMVWCICCVRFLYLFQIGVEFVVALLFQNYARVYSFMKDTMFLIFTQSLTVVNKVLHILRGHDECCVVLWLL